MFRSFVKDIAASAISWTRIGRLARRNVFVAGYHRVVDKAGEHDRFALPAMEISVATLEKQLDWIGRRYEFVSVDEIADATGPVAAVTFDDGYVNDYTHAFPLMKRKGIPAAFFVVTDLVGRDVPVHDRLYAALAHAAVGNAFALTQHLVRTRRHDDILRLIEALDPDSEIGRSTTLKPLTWEMLTEMRDAGMTIGSHSRTHAFLTNEDASRVKEELEHSRSALQQRLAVEAHCFAYPGGAFNATVVDSARAAGYRIGFTDCAHSDERFPMLTIRRRGLWERASADRNGNFSPAIMSCHAASVFDRFSLCSNGH